MANTPLPQSWTVLGSAVVAVKLSTQGVSNCCFFLLLLLGWDLPSLITWLSASEPFFFFKLKGRLSPKCSSHLLKGCQNLCDFPCGDPLHWLKQQLCPGIS